MLARRVFGAPALNLILTDEPFTELNSATTVSPPSQGAPLPGRYEFDGPVLLNRWSEFFSPPSSRQPKL